VEAGQLTSRHTDVNDSLRSASRTRIATSSGLPFPGRGQPNGRREPSRRARRISSRPGKRLLQRGRRDWGPCLVLNGRHGGDSLGASSVGPFAPPSRGALPLPLRPRAGPARYAWRIPAPVALRHGGGRVRLRVWARLGRERRSSRLGGADRPRSDEQERGLGEPSKDRRRDARGRPIAGHSGAQRFGRRPSSGRGAPWRERGTMLKERRAAPSGCRCRRRARRWRPTDRDGAAGEKPSRRGRREREPR